MSKFLILDTKIILRRLINAHIVQCGCATSMWQLFSQDSAMIGHEFVACIEIVENGPIGSNLCHEFLLIHHTVAASNIVGFFYRSNPFCAGPITAHGIFSAGLIWGITLINGVECFKEHTSEVTPTTMAAFGQEVALQWELSGELFFFTVPKFDTRLEHSDGGNHVAGTTGPLILHSTSEIVSFKVWPVEFSWYLSNRFRTSDILLGFCKYVTWWIKWSSDLSEVHFVVVSKLLHVNLRVGHGSPRQVWCIVNYLSEVDSVLFWNIMKSAHCAWTSFSLRKLHRW